MHTTAIRPWVSSGIALAGAAVIAVAPIAPPQAPLHPVHAHTVHLPALDLRASIVDIFTFPVLRQWAANLVLDYGTYGVAIAQAGANVGKVIGAIPETVVLFGQQILTGDLQGALTTIEGALIGSIAAVGAPLLDAFITVRQRILARQSELQAAVPAALIGVGTGFLLAIDGVLRSGIAGGQEIVDAVLSLDLGNIVGAIGNASRNFLGSFVEGGQDIVNGIVFAQQTIATALAAQPPADAGIASVTTPPNPTSATVTLSTKSTVDQGVSQTTTSDRPAADYLGKAMAADATKETTPSDSTDSTGGGSAPTSSDASTDAGDAARDAAQAKRDERQAQRETRKAERQAERDAHKAAKDAA
jgi:hypothetical protein